MEMMPMFSLFGGVMQGMMGSAGSQNSSSAQAAAYNYNMQIAQQNAVAAQQAAAANASQQNTMNEVNRGKMLAAMAANGYETDSGTPLLLLDQEARQGELAKQNILYQGQIQQNNFTNQAAIDSMQAASAIKAGSIASSNGLASGLLNGIGSYGKLQGQQTMLTSAYDQIGS